MPCSVELNFLKMNKLFFTFLLCFSLKVCVSQTAFGQQMHHYYVTISNPESLQIEFTESSNQVKVTSNDKSENAIFQKYQILDFRLAYPNTLKETFKNVYRIAVNNPLLIEDLRHYNPNKYTNIKRYTPIPNAYYPNDYGTTSPVENLGAPYPLTALDAMNVPGAWGITKGNPKVVIGISDARVDSTHIDLQGRVSQYLRYSNAARGSACSHGTGIAGIIGAIADNGHGRPGVCSDCDLIVNGYGHIDRIQELVEAGAKVINASWSKCHFGAYHKNIEKRIQEYYDEGVIIVAAAGNGSDCNPYLRDRATNYGYPASYKNVISVTSVYGECGHYEDCIIEDEQYGIIANKLKDRHVRRQRMAEYGSFDKLTPINTHWATQHNLAVDIAAPAETFLMGRALCGRDDEGEYGGVSSTSTAYITGVIGLIWSANYCLASAEVESILKLTAADIENLPGNEPVKMLLGAGRADAYKAVKMAHEMQLPKGIVSIQGRDFYRFDFKLFSSPYTIEIQNQTFRDSTTVDFTARKNIALKPGTKLQPDKNGHIKLSIDPNLPTEECFPTKPIPKPRVERDSIYSAPKYEPPFHISRANNVITILPNQSIIDGNYSVTLKTEEEVVFKESYSKEKTAEINLEKQHNQIIEVEILTPKYKMNETLSP